MNIFTKLVNDHAHKNDFPPFSCSDVCIGELFTRQYPHRFAALADGGPTHPCPNRRSAANGVGVAHCDACATSTAVCANYCRIAHHYARPHQRQRIGRGPANGDDGAGRHQYAQSHC